MNCENSCISGSEIVSLLWKIGSDPWISNHTTPFTQGDQATALLKVELNDCDSFEGLTLDAFVQVPNPDQDIVKIHATIDSDNKAIFTLPNELLWWPGGYTVNFMFTDGSKVNYSNIVNNAYTVNVNPALAGEDPPTILPGDIAVYEQLIADLNAENTRAETNLPLLEAENERAEQNIIDAGEINVELEGTIEDAETAKTNLEGAISDSETAKGNLEQTITDSETAKTNLEGTIADAGQAQSDLQEKIDEVPGLIQDITVEGNAQVERVEYEGDTQENRITNQGNTQVGRVETEGNAQVTRVNNQGTIEVNRVSSEGTTQVIRVGNKGDEEYQRLNDLIQTSPEGGNAMLLDGRTRTSFEEDIESRQYALDSRLVYAFEPHKRNIENLEHGVYVKNPLTNGDGTIKSEDADSMAGVFNDDDKNFYCGEGYENLFRDLSGYGCVLTETTTDREGWLKYELSGDTQSYGGLYKIRSTGQSSDSYRTVNMVYDYSDSAWTKITNITGDKETFASGISSSTTAGKEYQISEMRNGYLYYENVTENTESLTFFNNRNSSVNNLIWDVGDAIYVKIEGSQYTNTSQVNPFVKDTAQDGKLIIKEPWTSETHSFIFINDKSSGFATTLMSIFTKMYIGSWGNGESYFFDNTVANDRVNLYYDSVISNVFTRVIYENGEEFQTFVQNAGLVGDGILNLQADSYSESRRINSGLFVYKGNLTEQELRNELEKIKSGQYYVPNTGVYEPVQGAGRRYNEYGQAKNFVYITSTNTDIQLVEESKRAYTEDTTGTMFVDLIDASGVITGAGKIVDVDGYIRTTEANLKVRIEKEQL